jgi:HAMP domain-containing protein
MVLAALIVAALALVVAGWLAYQLDRTNEAVNQLIDEKYVTTTDTEDLGNGLTLTKCRTRLRSDVTKERIAALEEQVLKLNMAKAKDDEAQEAAHTQINANFKEVCNRFAGVHDRVAGLEANRKQAGELFDAHHERMNAIEKQIKATDDTLAHAHNALASHVNDLSRLSNENFARCDKSLAKLEALHPTLKPRARHRKPE